MSGIVLFISDLHLDPERPASTDLFLRFIETRARNAAALYILGDLFESWVGDDDPRYEPIITALTDTVNKGTPVFVMHGNRDFMMAKTFAERTGCTLIEDPTRLQLDGRNVLLMHGDTLCTDDREYQAFRATTRNPAWQQAALQKPLEERLAIAAHMREESRRTIAGKPEEIMDVNAEAVLAVFRESGVDCLVHGHTHRPRVHELTVDQQPVQRIVLGDWYTGGSVLAVENGEFRLQTLD